MPLRSNHVRNQNVLTLRERELIELLPPLIADTDATDIDIGLVCLVPVALCDLYQLFGVIWVDRIHEIEKV